MTNKADRRRFDLLQLPPGKLVTLLIEARETVSRRNQTIRTLKKVLAPIAAAIRLREPHGYRESDWNPDAHAENITLTIREARAVLKEAPDA